MTLIKCCLMYKHYKKVGFFQRSKSLKKYMIPHFFISQKKKKKSSEINILIGEKFIE